MLGTFFDIGYLPAIFIVLIALLAARLCVQQKILVVHHEFDAVDGLRGFLAVFVFIHHTTFWFNYSKGAGWVTSGPDIFLSFGSSSVSLFFMLTGFLFSIKLLDGRKKEIDWFRVYVSRVLRITPLYLCLIFIMFCVIAYNSSFTLDVLMDELRPQLLYWILFIIPGSPDINHQMDTRLITSGVMWTLAYEWYFYLILPVLALFFGAKSKAGGVVWLLLAALCIVFFDSWKLHFEFFYAFFGGSIAALASRTSWIKKQCYGRSASCVVVICIVVGYTSFGGGADVSQLIMFTCALTLIACGANVFGLLTNSFAKSLSSISYGIYLLHGLVLYIVFSYVIPVNLVDNLTSRQQWIVACLTTPALILLSSFSWHYIEYPAMRSVASITAWLRCYGGVNINKNSCINNVHSVTLTCGNKADP